MTKTNSTKKVLALFLAVLTILTMFSMSASAATKVKITKCDFSYTEQQYYTGSAIKPAIKVTYGKKTLVKNTDYTVAYSNNKNIGTGTIAVTGKGNYTGTLNFFFTISLKAPSGLKASSITTKSAKLSWNKVTGATKYFVYKYNTGTKKWDKVTTVTTNYATVSVSSGVASKFMVKANCTKGTSATSSAISVTGTLAAPTLKASATSTNSITLSWSKVAGATGYKIYSYNASQKKYTLIKTIANASTVSFVKTGLSAATTYAYAVKSYKTANGSTTLSAYSTLVYMHTKPLQVAGLKVTKTSSTVVGLSWVAVTGATGYKVYKYDASTKKYTLLTTTTSTSADVTGLSGSTKYNFAVSAYKKANNVTVEGAKSAKVTTTTLVANDLTKFLDMVNGKKFKISYSITADGTKVTGTSIANGNVAATKMKTTLEGISMNMNTVYYETKKSGYVYATAMGFMKVYQVLNEATAKENGLDIASQVSMFAPDQMANTNVTTGKETVSGKACTTYKYLTTAGAYVTYYFYSGKLIQIKSGSEVITISSYTSSVSSDDYKLPTAFPSGYVKTDLF